MSFTRTPTLLFKQAGFLTFVLHLSRFTHLYYLCCLHTKLNLLLLLWEIFPHLFPYLFLPHFTITIDPVVFSLKLCFVVVQLLVGLDMLSTSSIAEPTCWEHHGQLRVLLQYLLPAAAFGGGGVMWLPSGQNRSVLVTEHMILGICRDYVGIFVS